MRLSHDSLIAFVAGVAVGAALMYVAGPIGGRRRRSLMRDKADSPFRHMPEAVEGTVTDLRNRAVATAAAIRASITESEVEDAILVERIRSQLGHVVSHPRAIVVAAKDGRVTLSGDIYHDELDAVLDTVRYVPGVQDVRNNLVVHYAADSIPGLQTAGVFTD